MKGLKSSRRDRGRDTWCAILEDALPCRARAPTPARIAASRNSDSARKKASDGGSGGGIPRAAAYFATSCCSLGTPSGSGDGSDGSVGMPCTGETEVKVTVRVSMRLGLESGLA